MNFKKLFLSTVAGISLMALAASSALAADINIWGASAQFNFWKNNGETYLASRGCTDIQHAQKGAKDYIIKATCGTETVYMRSSSKASYDACYALAGKSGAESGRVTTCDVTGDSTSYFKRPFIEETTCTWGTKTSPGTCTTGNNCETVTVGASDTACKCFTQKSQGQLQGPLGGGAINRAMSVTEPNVNKCTPMIVPFAFFVNNTVTKNGGTIDSISYDNLQLIFSGNVFNWSEIFDADGVAYDAQPLVACMRHAGSGTQASLEAYLMASSNCSKYNYLAWQQSDGLVYFNDGSSDMMKCVNGYDNWLGTGAIGYADADQTVGTGTPYPNTSRIQLNGVPYTLNFANMKAAMVNGQYNFYGAQHLYGVAPTDPICTFLANPDNYSAPFAAACEMTYTRKNTCCAWGQTYQGNVCP
ncbi:hypothetical protein ER57_05575 [Smithella sp. SCADC]|jgi:ABC-type phosphate transport system substrate-binding protein|nr:hypothetical protein ER57_05575 [Smithella sp. SCADC]